MGFKGFVKPLAAVDPVGSDDQVVVFLETLSLRPAAIILTGPTVAERPNLFPGNSP